METLSQSHAIAMRYADAGDRAMKRGKVDMARTMYAFAAHYEQSAARAATREPSISILYKSAIVLWQEANRPDRVATLEEEWEAKKK